MESTVAKLRRIQSNLSQVQDIAGIRLTVLNRVVQDHCTALMLARFPEARITDYRDAPNRNYRAVHFIAGRLYDRFELQIRTEYQGEWGNTSERLADLFGIEVKYGLGPAPIQSWLATYSDFLAIEDRRRAGLFIEAATASEYLARRGAALETGRLLLERAERGRRLANDDTQAVSVRLWAELEEIVRDLLRP